MKEITNILAAYDRLDFTQRKAALATVVHVAGSSYRREGARMLIVDDGHWTGGISGGCLEDDTIRKANMAIFQQKPRVVRYDTTQDDPFQIGIGLGCKGIIDVLIEPLDATDPFNPVELLRIVADQRGDAALGVVTASDSPEVPVGLRILKTKNVLVLNMTPLADWGRLTSEVQETLENGASRKLEMTWTDGQAVQFFVEMLPPPIHLVAVGSNHDLLPLLQIGQTLGWRLTVVGNLRKIKKPIFELAMVVAEFDQLPVPPDARTAVVLMSHDYKTDFANLQKLLPAQSEVGFVIRQMGVRSKAISRSLTHKSRWTRPSPRPARSPSPSTSPAPPWAHPSRMLSCPSRCGSTPPNSPRPRSSPPASRAWAAAKLKWPASWLSRAIHAMPWYR